MAQTQRAYLPAAGQSWLLPLYDVMTKLMGGDQARAVLLGQTGLMPGQRILDIGCGTGSLAILLKQRYPQIEIVGLDPDPKALARARRKAQRVGAAIQFVQGFSDALEYPAGSFDHVFSSFMFHHLENDQKDATLREVRRVLKSGAHLHLLDFTGPEAAGDSSVSRWLHSHHRLNDNSESRIITMMTDAGFQDVKVAGRRTVLFGFGHVAYYLASVPGSVSGTGDTQP